MGKLKRISSLFIVFLLIFSCSFSSYADVWTDSNAVMTLDLDDEDYGISTYSSLGTVTNTVDSSGVQFYVYYNDASAGVDNVLKYGDISLSGGRFNYSIVLDDGDEITSYGFQLKSSSLPSPGDYNLSFDVSSDFSFEYDRCNLYFVHQNKNATNETSLIKIYPEFFSGDAYLSGFEITLNSLYRMNFTFYIDSPLGNAVGGSVAFNFTVASVSSDAYVTPGSNTSTEDYQSSVSDSLGSISSSIDSAAESLEYISTSQGLIIEGIDNVIMHISDQLYAFWDQLYNLIHEPQMAKMDEIIDAIENIDLEVNINLDKLKSSIDTMNSDLQNKLQNVQQTITGGYDNSGMESDATELDNSLKDYEEAEDTVLDTVNDSLNDFEFDTDLSEYTSIIAVISDFLQALYESSGGFKLVINFSMLLSIASLVIGVYRFRDGG